MKIPVEEMQAAFRKRRQESGDTRPAKKPRREAPVRPVPVPEKPVEITAEAAEKVADEPARGSVEETVPTAEERRAGEPAGGGGDGGDFPVAEEDCVGAEGARPAEGPTVIEVDSPVIGEEPHRGATAEDAPAAEEQREAEAPVPAPEEEAGPAGEAGAEKMEGAGVEADLDTPLGPSRPKAAVQKVKGRLPRPVKALPVMDDAARAERVFAGVQDPRFQGELRGLSLDQLLDVSVVGLLRAAAGTQALRAAVAGAGDALAQASERAEKYKKRCGDVARKYGRKLEEAKAKENHLGGRLIVAELERDSLRSKLNDEESKSSVIFAQCEAAEEAAKAAEERAEAADGKVKTVLGVLDGMAADNEKLHKMYTDAADRAGLFKIAASDAARRAVDAEARAKDAEVRVRDAEAAAAEAREEVRAIRARAAEAETKSRKKGAQDYATSAEFRAEMTEAATDGFLKGFEACRGKVAAICRVDGLDDLQPFENEEEDDGEADGDGDGGAGGEAGGGADGGSE